MKKITLMILMAAALVVFWSCSDKEDTLNQIPYSEEIDQSVVKEVLIVCNAPVYFSDISDVPAEMISALHKCFPNTSTADEATVAFISDPSVPGDLENIEKIKNRNGILVTIDPPIDLTEYKHLTKHLGQSTGMVPLIHATADDRKFYTVMGLEDDEMNEEICTERVMQLARWINGHFAGKANAARRMTRTDSDAKSQYDALTTDFDNVCNHLTLSLPTMHLEESVDIPYWDVTSHKIKATGSVDINFMYYPLYKTSCNDDKAGDYYVVSVEITPYNQQMWQTWSCTGGIFENATVWMVGYWFKNMTTMFTLCDANGNPIEGIDYFKTPVPMPSTPTNTATASAPASPARLLPGSRVRISRQASPVPSSIRCLAA